MDTNPRPPAGSNQTPADPNTTTGPGSPVDLPDSKTPNFPPDLDINIESGKISKTQLIFRSLFGALVIGGILTLLLISLNPQNKKPKVWEASLNHFSCGPTRLEGPTGSIEAQTGNFFCTAKIEMVSDVPVTLALADQELSLEGSHKEYRYSPAAQKVMNQPTGNISVGQKSIDPVKLDLIFEVPEYPYQQHITYIYLKRELPHQDYPNYDLLSYEGLQSYQRHNQVAETAVNMLRNHKEKTGHWPGHVADLNWAYGVPQDWNLEGDWSKNLPNHENASKITDLKTLLGREPYHLMDLRPDGYYLRDRIFVVLEATCDPNKNYIENWQTPESAVIFYASHNLGQTQIICNDV